MQTLHYSGLSRASAAALSSVMDDFDLLLVCAGSRIRQTKTSQPIDNNFCAFSNNDEITKYVKEG
jgi:hypothetical protein